MSGAESGDLQGRSLDLGLVRRLLRFAHPHRKGFYLSTALLLILSFLTLSIPQIIAWAIDHSLKPVDTEIPADERLSGIFIAAVLLATVGALTFIVRMTQVFLTNRTGQRVIHDLRLAVFSHITRRDLRFFDRHPVGALVTRVTGDIETLNEFFVSGVDVLCYDVVRITGIIIVLFWIDWRMALATLAVVPFILGWAFWFQREARRLFRTVRGKISQLNAFLAESLNAVRVIQLFRRERAVTARFEQQDGELKKAHVATVWNFSWFFPGIEFLPAVGTALLMLVGYYRIQGGTMAIGSLVAFWLYHGYFIEPLRQLADKFNILQAAVAAGERVFRVLDDTSGLPVPEAPTPLHAERGDLSFDHVSFAYDPRKPVLRDLSFTVTRGQRIAIVGPTGSGKSTVISLLCRFYDPVEGTIRIGGTDLKDVDPRVLRRQIGVVLQDVFLFDGTVRENLSLGDASISDARILEAARTVQADGVLERLGGLDGRIRERGATLSTGEKQLLVFARTLAHDPRILVLDEATAHIDTVTEILLKNALDQLTRGRTSIVIAHRLSTIQDCDRILVLHHGQLRETGTHSELLRKDGIYARLFRLQFATTALPFEEARTPKGETS